MKKILIFVFSLLTMLTVMSCNDTKKDTKEKVVEIEKSTEKPEEKKVIKEEITIVAVGDIMLGSNYPSKDLLPKGNENVLKEVSSILNDSDITFGNLEGTLFDTGGVAKTCGNPAACYVFRTPSEYGVYLKEAGFDFMSIANNHSGDFGPEGRKQTIENLDKLGIKYSGLKDQIESTTLEKDGVKYGLISFAPNRGTVSINDYEYAKELIQKTKTEVDILIVSIHGGAEGNAHQAVPKKEEVFYGENRGNVEKFAHMAVDSGADIILGHGPHVTRAIELYNGKFIAYSMGNFATYGKFNLAGPSGIAPIFKIKLNSEGDFISGEIISTYQVKGYPGPRVDPNKQVVQKLISLTKKDFPNTALDISEEGKITKK